MSVKHVPKAKDSLQTEIEKCREAGGHGESNTGPQGHLFNGLQRMNAKSISENKVPETMILKQREEYLEELRKKVMKNGILWSSLFLH